MNIELYRTFFYVQNKHWWFITKRIIVMDLIKRHIDIHKEPKILDIGCGSGLMLNHLKKIGHTYGMDMSDEAIKFSKEIFNGKVEKGSMPDNIPFENVYFDLIILLDVIEHIDQDAASLVAIRDRLIPGGKAIITVPANMFLWSDFDEINQHKRRYSISELRWKLTEAGFKIEKISYYNTILFPLVYIVRLLNRILNRSSASDLKLPSWPVNHILKSIFGLEKYLLRIVNLPFGVSILAVVERK